MTDSNIVDLTTTIKLLRAEVATLTALNLKANAQLNAAARAKLDAEQLRMEVASLELQIDFLTERNAALEAGRSAAPVDMTVDDAAF